tara:strand:- start:368 stop:1666 length:1299 start_codon:yes stop_codon:yes gene_type:complete
MLGRGSQPSNDILQKLAVEAYAGSPQENIGSFRLMAHTPTLKFYRGKDNTILVGIRGTADTGDLKADAMIGLNKLEDSARFKEDLRTLEQFQQEHTAGEYDYFGVGHSLGGAILDLFLTKGMIKSGISYNPAIQPLDIVRKDIPNHRIYFVDDALYKTMGRFSHNPEVRYRTKWKDFALSKIPAVGPLNAHLLGRFEGGSVYSKAKDLLLGGPSVGSLAASAVVNVGSKVLIKRYNYPPSARTVLSKSGDLRVTRIDVCRTPLPWTTKALLQGLSLGQFNSAMKEVGYDKLFHLYLRIELEGREVVLVEKNQVLNVSMWKKDPSGQECMPVPITWNRTHTLMDMLEMGRKDLGDDDFFIYDAFGRNCQMFVLGVLRASELLTPDIRQFIYQPTSELVQKLGSTFPRNAKFITDLAHTADIVLHGQGQYEAMF